MTTELQDRAISPGVIEALAIAELPDIEWLHDDDRCDCTFQRIGMWKNPYLAEQQEIRLCCIWAKLGEMFPDYVRTIPGYWDDNAKAWLTVPWEWNGEAEMPKALWYRQLARKENRPLAEVRAEYSQKDELRPKGTAKREPILFILLHGGREIVFDFAQVTWG